MSVVLPTYNEAENIIALIEALDHSIAHPKEIIVVDDDSPDGTSQRVAAFIASRAVPHVRLETRTRDRGLTRSIAHGIAVARGDTVVWMDCDFSHPPEIVPELLRKVEEGHDIAVASRYMRGGSYKSGLGWFGADESALAVALSRMINWGIRMSLKPGFHDFTSGFIAIRRHVFDRIHLTGDYGEYFIDLMFRAMLLGHSYAEIPFTSPPRRAGVSKTGTTFRQLFRRGRKYLWTVLRMWKWRIRHWLGRSIEG